MQASQGRDAFIAAVYLIWCGAVLDSDSVSATSDFRCT